MTTRSFRRWLFAALFIVSVFPFSALAQSTDLAITVADVPDPVVAGSGADNLTHTITVTNTGLDTTGVIVQRTGNLAPAGVLGPSWTPPSQGTFDGLNWQVGDLTDGGSATLVLTFSVDATAADGDLVTSIFNLVATDVPDSDPSNDQDITESTTIAREFDLGLSVVDDPDPVVAGSGAGNLTHTFTLSRSGPSDAAGVQVDLVPSLPTGVALIDAVATVGSVAGTTWTVGDWAASENGNDQTLTLTLTVDSTAADCTGCISATGTVSAANGTDTNPANDTAVDPTSIAGQFDLALSVVDNPDPVLAGSGAGNLTHTFTLSRVGGPSDAPGVAVDIVPSLPAGVAIDSAVPSVGSWAGTTWTVGDVPASTTGNIGTLTITLTVDATATDCTDCVSATGTISTTSGTDTNPSNDTAVDPTSIETAASVPSGFLTTVAFTNGYAGTVGVTISCNNGLPLTQSKDISAASGVNFIVASLDFIAPDTVCDISVDIDSGYVATVLANGEDTGGACAFSGTPVADESAAFALDRANTCEITAEPVQSQFIVHKDWVIGDDGNTPLTGEIDIWCAPAAEDTGDQFGTVSTTAYVDGDGSFYLDFYPSPGGATCYAEEDVDSSAVESSSTCSGGVPFAVGDTAKTCVITNTVFYEGIPTLSQYGLAILALLMLGVGFMGLRRFT